MIELVIAEACIACDKCIDVCPTDVFSRTESGVPEIARHDSCQTCFMCEAYCPTDALYVHPEATPLPDHDAIDRQHVGRYREQLGWGRGREPGARTAIGPELPKGELPPRLSR